MKHKHADLIHAWAEGAEIQLFQTSTGKWIDLPNPPEWGGSTYRIKPTELPSGFLPWLGGKCPVKKGTSVDVIYRDGGVLYDLPANELDDRHKDRDASCAFWNNDNALNDIVAYRIKPEEKKPVVRWLWACLGSNGTRYATSVFYDEETIKTFSANNPIKLEWSRTEFPE